MDRYQMEWRYWYRVVCVGMVSPVSFASTRWANVCSLVALKVLLGLSLLSYSALREGGMEEREAEDTVNDFGRSAVGENKEESVRLPTSYKVR